ncbi:hypothetical protein LCGC14_0821840 [marine sediment metagenome]|uniref:C1q domain-containing protein n=1 Tax=marine sediment metagenome TaxID=412755 RepID=A0A0F9PIH1_9ZZZZ
MATIDELSTIVAQLVEANENLQQSVKKLLRQRKLDFRIPQLATGFDIEDVIFPPTVRVTNGAQIISNNITTTFTFDTETWDTDGMHSTASNTSRLTVKTTGKYRYSAHIRWDAHGTGVRAIRILLNNATVINQIVTNDTPNDAVDMQITGTYELSIGSYIELQGFQNSGGNLATETASGGSEFSMEWISS